MLSSPFNSPYSPIRRLAAYPGWGIPSIHPIAYTLRETIAQLASISATVTPPIEELKQTLILRLKGSVPIPLLISVAKMKLLCQYPRLEYDVLEEKSLRL